MKPQTELDNDESYAIVPIACLLPSELPSDEAVEQALEIMYEAKLRVLRLHIELAKQAASIPGNLSTQERFKRIDDLKRSYEYYCPTGPICYLEVHVTPEASSEKIKWVSFSPDSIFDVSSREFKAEMKKFDAQKFAPDMSIQDFLRILLPKKKTYKNRFEVYRIFNIDAGVTYLGFSDMKRERPKATKGSNLYYLQKLGTTDQVLYIATIFKIWLPYYEKWMLSQRGSKGGKAKAAKAASKATKTHQNE